MLLLSENGTVKLQLVPKHRKGKANMMWTEINYTEN